VLITGDWGHLPLAGESAEDAQRIIDRDPYQQAGLVAYERVGFNAAFRAPGL
jgi:uncharacterized protein